MKRPLLAAIFFLTSIILLTGNGCKKAKTDTSLPSVTTQDVMLDVTATSAQSGGTITGIGGSSVSANGIVYSTSNHTPTLSDTKVTSATITNSYSFAANMTGLTPSTTYYVRAYASNQFGTAYGAVVTFTTNTTLSSIAGVVTTVAGNGSAGAADGTGDGAQFSNPGGMAVDAQGNIYIADTFNNLIRKMTPDGTVTTIAGNGTAGYTDGPAASAQFYAPAGLAVDAQGVIYVADYGNNVIRKITTDGTVSTFAGNGYPGFVDGAASKVAAFRGPSGVAVDTKGNVFVADQNNNLIRKIYNGNVSLVAGTAAGGYTNATVDSVSAVWGAFNHPSAIAVGTDGNIYVADRGNSAIRKITFPGRVITTIAGGPAQTALVGLPSGLAIDAQGNIFLTDEAGKIIELTSARTLYDLAGVSGTYSFADGTGTAALFNQPQGIAVDANGNIYIADYNNNRIRKLVITQVGN